MRTLAGHSGTSERPSLYQLLKDPTSLISSMLERLVSSADPLVKTVETPVYGSLKTTDMIG